jgi:lysine 2,3-aminomutase
MADHHAAKRTEPPHEPVEPPGRCLGALSYAAGEAQQTLPVTSWLERDVIESVRNLLLPRKPREVVPHAPRFACGTRAQRFRRRFFPEVSSADWNDWRWQVRNRLRGQKALSRILRLSEDEARALENAHSGFPVSVTPYYASLLSETDPLQPLRRTVIPVCAEQVRGPGEADDPLGEDGHSPVPGLVHRYPDRVLFLVTGFCSTFCRYCTRSRMVGRSGDCRFSWKRLERAIEYIESRTEVRDVLLSGGDPLTLSDEALCRLLERIRRIPHVEIIRIGTKAPAVMPQRITPALTRMLKRFHPLWMSLHFAHPEEITPETAQACARLSDAGIPLGSQTVLLRGVNDSVDVMTKLVHGLLKIRVRPYYLYQCDPISGSSHFRTTVEQGLTVIKGLRGHTSGYAVPHYVIDAPGGGGKIPLLPDYSTGREGSDILLRNYEDKVYRYPDPEMVSLGGMN